jgi:hypothetical protein
MWSTLAVTILPPRLAVEQTPALDLVADALGYDPPRFSEPSVRHAEAATLPPPPTDRKPKASVDRKEIDGSTAPLRHPIVSRAAREAEPAAAGTRR